VGVSGKKSRLLVNIIPVYAGDIPASHATLQQKSLSKDLTKLLKYLLKTLLIKLSMINSV